MPIPGSRREARRTSGDDPTGARASSGTRGARADLATSWPRTGRRSRSRLRCGRGVTGVEAGRDLRRRGGRVLRGEGPAGPGRVVRRVPRREEAVVGPAARLARGDRSKGGERARRSSRASPTRACSSRPSGRRTTTSRCRPRGSSPTRPSTSLAQLGQDGRPLARRRPIPSAEVRDQARGRTGRSSRSEPVAPPAVEDAAWVATPVDAFILARLEAEGLAPVARGRPADPDPPRHVRPDRPAADPRGGRRVRRPTTSPDAFARVVDRLLASPRYGERWGRHWLDVARYADTKGYVFTRGAALSLLVHLPRLRRSASFNEDLPYDRFLVEQLAADRLAARRRQPRRWRRWGS